MSSLVKVVLTALGLLIAAPSAWAVPSYSFSLIDLAIGQTTGSRGPVINDLGQIAYGNGIRDTSGNWSLLPPLGSPDPGPGYAEIYGINNVGQAVGTSTTPGGFYMTAVVWNNGVPTTVEGTDGARGSSLVDINDAGQYVGNAFASAGAHYIISNAPRADGPVFGFETANAINANGHVVGTTVPHQNIPAAQAALWTPTTRTVLDNRSITDSDGNVVAYWESVATNLNDLDQVVGYAGYETGTHATLWENGNQIDLGTLGGSGGSTALAINNAGVIVGASDELAMTFQSGQMYDLNTLISTGSVPDGWVLSTATDINQQGWIVGTLWNAQQFRVGIYLLKPIATAVPEPSAWLLLLGGIAFILHRSKRNQITAPAAFA